MGLDLPSPAFRKPSGPPTAPQIGGLLMGYLYSYILKGSDQNGHKTILVYMINKYPPER